MKILHANKFYYNRGGAESAYFALADLLARRGHEVVPFAMQDPGNIATAYSRYFVSNVELRDDGASPLAKLTAATRILYSREAEQKIERLIEDIRPDVAHLHNIYHQISPSILRALRRHRIPTVMTLHDYKILCPAYTLYSNGEVCERCNGHRYYNAVLRACVRESRVKSAICALEAYFHSATGAYRKNADLFIAPSDFLRGKAIEFGVDQGRIITLPNFIDASGAPMSETYGNYFLYSGRIDGVKGLHTLLRAVRSSSAISSFALWIAGDGEQRPQLEEYSRVHGLDNVRFLGQLSQDELAPVIAHARFVVLPSEWYENAPMSVLEAAARGKAAVVSNIGGLPELVRDGDTGVIVPPGDVTAWRAAIEQLLADPQRAVRMGRRARSFVEEAFGPDKHYQDLMNIYQRAGARVAPEIVGVS